MEDYPDPWPDETSGKLLALIKPELKPDERLLWASRADRPSPSDARRAVGSGWTWGLGFGAVGAACIPVAAVLSKNTLEPLAVFFTVVGLIAALFSVLTLLAALGNAVWWSDERRRRAGRVYALTDSRALIWDPMPKSTALTVHTFIGGRSGSSRSGGCNIPTARATFCSATVRSARPASSASRMSAASRS